MLIIGTEKLNLSFGEKVLLHDVSFSVNQGDKVSVVGVNGAGKSTLMRLLYHRDIPYTGNIFIAKGKTIGHLEQQSRLDPEMSVYEAALSVFSSLLADEKRLEEFSEEMARNHSDELIARFAKLQQKFERDGGYEYKSRAKGTLISMGFSEETLHAKVSTLSGGQRTILQLSLLLLEEPDILLLDEPTNHLDIKSLEWLEDKLKKIRSTVLLISHDRLFLDHVTDKTLEIENTHAKLYSVPYTKYRQEKEKEREIWERHYKNQQKEIARIEAFIAQQKRWNREKNIIAAESRQKALDRMVKVEKVEQLPESLSFRFSPTLESGEDVLTIKKLSKRYDSKLLFSDLDLEVKKKDRLVIIGGNGTGKSTLLQILAGNLMPDSGTFQFGYNTRIGYYDQYQHLNENSTVLEEIWAESSLNHTQVRNLLATFLFKGDDVFKEIRVLSGGERARLVLAKLMQKKINVLLLDEPTNHLDIESREALENALLSFDGTIIAVSHDRYFIQKIASRILQFKGSGQLFAYNGTYLSLQNYQQSQVLEELPAKSQEVKQSANDWANQKKRKQDERKKQARIRSLENEIDQIEDEMRKIDQEALNNSSDYVKLQALYTQRAQLQEKCDALLEEWTMLQDEN